MSNAITDRPEDRPQPGLVPELGPSAVQQDEPTIARVVGSIGAALVIFSGMALLMAVIGRGSWLGPEWALLILMTGMSGLLYHSVFDRDMQFRRMYGLFSAVLLLLGLYFCMAPRSFTGPDDKPVLRWGAWLAWGVPSLLLGLLFQFSFQRNEDDRRLLNLGQFSLGGAGALLGVFGMALALFAGERLLDMLGLGAKAGLAPGTPQLYFLTYVSTLAICGLVLLLSFVAVRGVEEDLAYYTALGTGGVGLLVLLIALGRTLFATGGAMYFVNFGLVLMAISFAYAVTGATLALDWPFFVLFRRDLAAFFVSPLSYVALFAFGIFAWFSYVSFLGYVLAGSQREPVVMLYIFAILPVFVLQFLAPAITMRLLSEEARTGTLEVMFTSPVDEVSVVMAKFCAGMVTFLAAWAPFGLILLAIPLAGAKDFFDYRPLVSFAIVLVVTGAAFISVGLMFSSFSSDQIVSLLLSLGGMLAFTFVFFARMVIPGKYVAVREVLQHMSYLHVWQEALLGKIILRHLVFFLSITVLSLFISVKVLESRKWR
jgi:ABC-2 type transport system permease protein